MHERVFLLTSWILVFIQLGEFCSAVVTSRYAYLRDKHLHTFSKTRTCWQTVSTTRQLDKQH